MCECRDHSCQGPTSAAQSLDELDFERGLWYAAQYGDLERVLYLLNKGVQVDQRDSAGYTALHYAARNGHLNVCKLLIERGACVDAVTAQGKATPLHRASALGKLEVVKFLIEKKADCRLKDGDGRTALHRAAINKCTEICEFLVGIDATLKDEKDNHNKRAADYVQNTANLTLLT